LIGFADTQPEIEIQQCAGCHSRREAFQDGNPLPGTPFHDAYRLALLRPGLYHADGQILDEVYVYGSFLQSKMYAKGVRCSNCHEPHSGQLRAQGNAVCTQCHSPAGNEAFPSLTKKLYNDSSHHFHEPGTPGAECKSCHMIERTYMGIDGRRDHSFRVPRPDLSEKLGTPNACNDCHAEKPASWPTRELEKRFPNSTHRGSHYGEVLFGAQNNPNGFSKQLLEIAAQRSFAGIVRASALDLLASRVTPQLAESAAHLIQDRDPLVRAAAVSLQRVAPPVDKIQRIIGALEDPVKVVRIAAAREMLNMRAAYIPTKIKESMNVAYREWQEANTAKLDFPEIHMVLGGTALVMRNAPAAIAAFQEVTSLDPQMVPAWIMQVRILLAIGDKAGAQLALQKGLVANPGNRDLATYKEQFQ
jgi:predicted CXXCH cytochrome family protein